MSFESFPNMNTNPNEQPKKVPLSLAPEFEVKREVESEVSRKPLEGKGGEWVGRDFDVKHGIKNNPFDAAGRHVVGDEEAKKAEEMLKKLGSDASGLTLQ